MAYRQVRSQIEPGAGSKKMLKSPRLAINYTWARVPFHPFNLGDIKVNLKRLLLVAALTGAATAAISQNYSHTWNGTEATRLGRIYRDGVPSMWNMPKPFPGVFAPTQTFYWIHIPFTNPITTGDAIATVDVSDDAQASFVAAYSPSGPGAGDMSINYLGDEGGVATQEFSVRIPQGQNLVLFCTTVNDMGVGTTFHGTVTFTEIPVVHDWTEVGDAGQTIATAQMTSGTGTLTGITGSLSSGIDADIYCIRITDRTQFLATTVGGSGGDTQLFLFRPDGHGVTSDDDDPGGGNFQSTITGQFVVAPGIYYLAISTFDRDPVDASGNEIWNDTPYEQERQPDGPGAANPLANWNGSGSGDTYRIELHGCSFCQTIILQDSVTLNPGIVVSGLPADLNTSNDVYYTVRPGVVISSSQSPIVLTWTGHAPANTPGSLAATVETRAQQANIRQTIEAYNYSTMAYDQLDQRILPTTTPDTVVTSNITNPAQHIGAGNEVKLRISYKAAGSVLSYPWRVFMDQVIETYTP